MQLSLPKELVFLSFKNIIFCRLLVVSQFGSYATPLQLKSFAGRSCTIKQFESTTLCDVLDEDTRLFISTGGPTLCLKYRFYQWILSVNFINVTWIFLWDKSWSFAIIPWCKPWMFYKWLLKSKLIGAIEQFVIGST